MYFDGIIPAFEYLVELMKKILNEKIINIEDIEAEKISIMTNYEADKSIELNTTSILRKK